MKLSRPLLIALIVILLAYPLLTLFLLRQNDHVSLRRLVLISQLFPGSGGIALLSLLVAGKHIGKALVLYVFIFFNVLSIGLLLAFSYALGIPLAA